MEVVIKVSTVFLVRWRVNNVLVKNVGVYDRLDLHLEVIHKMKYSNSATALQSARNTSVLHGTLACSFETIMEYQGVFASPLRILSECRNMSSSRRP
jgi:hypothetical protein